MEELYDRLYNDYVSRRSGVICHGKSDQLLLLSCVEDGYLLQTSGKRLSYLGDFYGNPTCGLVSPDNQWAILGGDTRSVIWQQGEVREINQPGVFGLRPINATTVYILTDPWAADSAIWALNINTLETTRVRFFTDYADKPYTDHVTW